MFDSHFSLLTFVVVVVVATIGDAFTLYPTTAHNNDIHNRLQAGPPSLPSATIASSDTTAWDDTDPATFPTTPHSGCHFRSSHPQQQRIFHRLLPRRRRFMEGWYYRVTLPDIGSFAFIMSIEDPGSRRSPLKLATIQVIGPNDQYLVQADRDDTKFWALSTEQSFGCTFQFNQAQAAAASTQSLSSSLPLKLSAQDFDKFVDTGFQVQMPYFMQGKLRGHDGTLGGVLEGQGNEQTCAFFLKVDSIVAGWGDSDSTSQKSTGGWLASFAVFEPHWQVTLADARVSGWIQWNDQKYKVQDAPFYAEKNWGQALPKKWYWTQCNSFHGYGDLRKKQPTLSVTAGGGVRKVPFGQQESLGMVSVHYQGKFFEAVPWTGSMKWNVTTWGSWKLSGRCIETKGVRPFEVEMECTVDPATHPGLVFRAPTPDEGMVYFCRDTFEADTELSLWELVYSSQTKQWTRKEPPLIDKARSSQGGAEVGGGPWWDTWESDSELKPLIRLLLKMPYKVSRLWRREKQGIR